MGKINSFKKLISEFGAWSLFKKVEIFFSICLNSCRHSKINFFFQFVNFCLIILFFWFIFPTKLNSFINLDGLTGSIFGNFVLWVSSAILFPINKIFESSIKITIAIFLTVVFIITFCYIKLLMKAFSIFRIRIVYKFYD